MCAYKTCMFQVIGLDNFSSCMPSEQQINLGLLSQGFAAIHDRPKEYFYLLNRCKYILT